MVTELTSLPEETHMKITLADGLPYHPTLRHPKTGDRLRAIMLDRKGKPVWPVIGASEDNEEGEAGGDADKSEEEDKGEKGEVDKKPDPNAERIAQLEADIAKMRTHLSNSDKKKSAAEKALQDLKDKDLPDAEKARKEAAEARERSERQAVALRNLALTNAFLVASQKAKVNWHDPEVAQAAATKYEGIEVDEDGRVTGMTEVVRKLAKDKAFLVDSGKPAEVEEKEKNGPSGSSTGAAGGKKTSTKGQLDKEELHRKYPALRN